VNKSFYYIVILCAILFNISCNNHHSNDDFPYSINDEDQNYILPDILQEISGLAYAGDNSLFCINDENGVVYQFDLKQNKIVMEIPFGKDGDYEGITFVNDTIYVLKSNGVIYSISGFLEKEGLETEKVSAKMHKNCDAEGLCIDTNNNRLLIACKGNAGKGTIYSGKKAVYAYSAITNTLDSIPAYIINISDIHKLNDSGMIQRFYDDFMIFLGGKNTTFNPSAIAIHPFTNDIYMLSSVGNILLVMTNNGNLRYTIDLEHSKFKQPEGLTFDKNGTMYISNEGGNGKANIKVFKYNLKVSKDG
jgi:uncharacterized protein YjiK